MFKQLFQRKTKEQAFTNIAPNELAKKLDVVWLVDVRSAQEYSGGHVAGARLIPLDTLANRAHELPKDQPIACICRSGGRSRVACEQLAMLGFTQLQNVQGGMMAWQRARLPVAR
jgi:rhodanese-related sulfurtransferase